MRSPVTAFFFMPGGKACRMMNGRASGIARRNISALLATRSRSVASSSFPLFVGLFPDPNVGKISSRFAYKPITRRS
jgi:hypothetical protein